VIEMHHPALGRAHFFQPEQARVMRKSGWVDGPLPKSQPKQRASSTVSENKEEPSDG